MGKKYAVLFSFFLLSFLLPMKSRSAGDVLTPNQQRQLNQDRVDLPSQPPKGDIPNAYRKAREAEREAEEVELLRGCKSFYEKWIDLFSRADGSEARFPDFDGTGYMGCVAYAPLSYEYSEFWDASRACRLSENIGTCPAPGEWMFSNIIAFNHSTAPNPEIVRQVRQKFCHYYRSVGDTSCPAILCVGEGVFLAALGCQAEIQRRGE